MTNDDASSAIVRAPSGGLQQKLLQSHLTVAALGLAMLLLSLAFVVWLRRSTARMANLRSPTARSSAMALSGVQRSLAGLRGWIVLGEDEFKTQRRDAWNREIRPSLTTLKRLSRDWTKTDSEARLYTIERILADLEESQWWIEDVAQTPGNFPARVALEEHIEPTADIIYGAITALIDLEKQQVEGGRARKELFGTMADFRGTFTRSFSFLERYIHNSSDLDRQKSAADANLAQRHLFTIATSRQILSEQQREQLSVLEEHFRAYSTLAEHVVQQHSSAASDVAQHLLATEAAPLARQASGMLTAMANNQARLMADDARRAVTIGNIAMVASLVMIGLLASAAWIISNRRAARITQPLAKLSEATHELAIGHSVEDLPITSDDELGRLTQSFNEMRAAREAYASALRNSEQRIRTIVQSAPNGMLIVDQQGSIKLVNQQVEALFGYARDELIGQLIEVLVPVRFRENHPRLRDEFFGQPSRREMGAGRDLFGIRKDGSEFPVEIGLNPFETEEGLFVVAAIVDITERREQADELQRYADDLARSNEELDAFAYIASHDLKEPLRGINNYAAFLHEDYNDKLDDAGREKLDTLQRLCRRMEGLIDSLLHYSRVGRVDLAMDETDLDSLLHDVLDTLHISLDEQNIDVSIPRALPAIYCDRVRVAEVFRNLITNAMKYNDKPAKTIEIGYQAVDRSRAGEDVSKEALAPVFFVRDNGIGIREKHIEAIFRFFKRLHGRDKYGGGTGAGLTIVKKIVERHGGRIWVESQVGEGTTFYFTLQQGAGNESEPANTDY